MYSKTNPLDCENNIQPTPRSDLSHMIKDYKKCTPIIYHCNKMKIINQTSDGVLLERFTDNKAMTHELYIIRECKPEHIGEVSIRLSEDNDNSVILGISVHTSPGDKINTGIFKTLSELILKTHKALRIETRTLIRNNRVINSLLQSGYSFEGVSRQPDSNSEAQEFAVFSLLRNHRNTNRILLPPGVDTNIYRDEKIALRLAEPEDAYCIWLEQSNPESHKWSLFETASINEIKQKVDRSALNLAIGENILLTIIECATCNAVGKIVIRNVVPPHVGDVGYGILPEYRGLGYAARALNLLKKWAFDEAGYVRLELGVKEGNAASEQVAKKGGFQFEGIRSGRLRNHDGSYSNEMHYFLLNPNIEYRK